jgi:L-ascorbate metabolism protein UlaG (beta-lactamase superfamily)
MKHKPSDHFDGKRFFNPTLIGAGTEKKSFFKGLGMWLTTEKSPWPDFVENTHKPVLATELQANQIAITFINHVTFLLQLPGLNILTDPVWSQRASPFKFLGPKRVRKPGIALDDLPKIDAVIISHNHYDHLDKHTLAILQKKFAPQMIVPLNNKHLLPNKANVQELDWWQGINIHDNCRVTLTPTQHWSARSLFDQYCSLWGSYAIEYNGKKIFFGGDAGYSSHYADIHDRLGAMDIALLGIGAYEPRWFMRNMHKNPEEAVQAHLDLKSKLSIGMHFGTFRLSAESMQQPLIDLQTAKQQQGIPNDRFIALKEGETRVFDL